jgi:hypothetical protein
MKTPLTPTLSPRGEVEQAAALSPREEEGACGAGMTDVSAVAMREPYGWLAPLESAIAQVAGCAYFVGITY